jgi:2-oxoglutarate/2-oxoacid ferredoxin oxidoreductase subunit alpha
MEPGLKEIFSRFRKVMTVEINYSDEHGRSVHHGGEPARGQLAWLLRAQTLVDVDCWTRVLGEPMRPGAILRARSSRPHMPEGRCA